MSDITVSVNRNMDDAALAALANGDNVTINTGAQLLIDSDSRWGQQAAVIGNVTIDSATGGELKIDGTKTWWIPYTSGTSTVPSTGTTISGATTTASGELLGIWSALGVAPTSGGAGMPASGYVKLRSKVGNFNNYELLKSSGTTIATVNSSTGGQTGWIHIVGEEASTITLPRTGKLTISGSWFEAGWTNGSRGQTVQLPVGDQFPGVFIETVSGSDTFEFWPTVGGSWSSTYMSTDARCRHVEVTTAGLLRIGQTGAAVDVGDLPPTGCRIRIPNVMVSSATTPTWTNNLVNATLATRWDVTTTNAGEIEIDKCLGAGFYLSMGQAKSVSIKNSGFFEQIVLAEVHSFVTLSGVGIGISSNNVVASPITLTTHYGGGLVEDCKFTRYTLASSGNYGIDINTIDGFTFRNVWGICTQLRGNATTGTWRIQNSTNCTFSGIRAYGARIALVSCAGTEESPFYFKDYVYVDRIISTTGSTVAQYSIDISAKSQNITFDGYSFGGFTNVHPYSGLLNTATSDHIKLRNVGTPSSRLSLGSASQSAYIANLAGNNTDLEFKRIYVANTRTGYFNTLNSDALCVVENVWADAADVIGIQTLDALHRGCYLGGNNTGTTSVVVAYTSVYGNIFWDSFHSDTRGKIGVFFNEKSDRGFPVLSPDSYSIVAGKPQFRSTGALSMLSAGDEIIYTWPWYVLGYTGFTTDTVQIAGTNVTGGAYGFGNHRVQYDLDKGSGFSMSWQEFTGSNLNAESGISAATGFKLKLRITCITSSSTNSLTALYCYGATDSTSQQAQYDLDTKQVTVTLDNIVIGSVYRVEKISGGALLFNGVAVDSTVSLTYTHTGTDVPVLINVRKSSSDPRYQPYSTQGTITKNGLSVFISQVLDSIATVY